MTGLTGILPIVTSGGSVPSVSLIASGTSGQVLFNSSGSLVGNFGLTWDNTNKVLTVSGGSAPTIVAGAGAGGSPTLTLTGSDNHGIIELTTGAVPTGSNAYICTVTFGAGSYSLPPAVVFSPGNPNSAALATALLEPCTTSTSTSFSIISGVTGLTGVTKYIWNYINCG